MLGRRLLRIDAPDSANAGADVNEPEGLKRIAITEMVPLEVNSAMPLCPAVEANCAGNVNEVWPCVGSEIAGGGVCEPFSVFFSFTVMLCAVEPVLTMAIDVTKP